MKVADIDKLEFRYRAKQLGLTASDILKLANRHEKLLNNRKSVPLWLLRILELLEEKKRLEKEIQELV